MEVHEDLGSIAGIKSTLDSQDQLQNNDLLMRVFDCAPVADIEDGACRDVGFETRHAGSHLSGTSVSQRWRPLAPGAIEARSLVLDGTQFIPGEGGACAAVAASNQFSFVHLSRATLPD